ncbi:hypothetical protein AB0M80_08975 [Amycolatopsis sp. NPDC051045]|uniref:hypothetical protein n=1 Tax=Amycolatopsis sp. NPDC051045 TaxID=3156922 RepID=UPI00343DA456
MDQAALYGPIVEARDVVESYLRNRVVVAGWRLKLSEASRQFVALGEEALDADMKALGGRIDLLAKSDLTETDLARTVSADLERLLVEVRVPGLPKPEDDDWAF